jgi:DNA mismatch repair ATPase MutS
MLTGLCDRLKKLPDLEAILTTLHTRRVSPKRLLLLLTSLLDVATRVPTQTDAQAQVSPVETLVHATCSR